MFWMGWKVTNAQTRSQTNWPASPGQLDFGIWMHIYWYTLRCSDHDAHTTSHIAVAIRPLIFPSLPGSPGKISNGAAPTSRRSCSSHRRSTLISIDFISCFFSSSPASLVRILWWGITFLRWAAYRFLSLYNYTDQQHAIQFSTRFFTAEVIPPSSSTSLHLSASLRVHLPLSFSTSLFFLHVGVCPKSNSRLITLPLLQLCSTHNCDRFLSWSRRYRHQMTFWEDAALKTYTGVIILSHSPRLKIC